MPLIPALGRNIRQEESVHTHSLLLRFLEAGPPFQTEVEIKVSGWLFCFFDIRVETQYLSLGFYKSCYDRELQSVVDLQFNCIVTRKI